MSTPILASTLPTGDGAEGAGVEAPVSVNEVVWHGVDTVIVCSNFGPGCAAVHLVGGHTAVRRARSAPVERNGLARLPAASVTLASSPGCSPAAVTGSTT